MLLSHRIRIDATPQQHAYFVQAAGTARRVWNHALAQWNHLLAIGQRPNAMQLKKQFNAIKYCHPDWLDENGRAWLRTIHRDAHAQPFANLARAWQRYFAALRAGEPAYPPRFKKKGRSRDSFYVANDKLRIGAKTAVLPKVGEVALTEALRWPGKIMGACVSREADHWFLAVQVDVPDEAARCQRNSNGIIGIDLGIIAAVTLDTGEKVAAPRPLKGARRRVRIRSRRQSRKHRAAKARAGIDGALPKGARLPRSKNQVTGAKALARLQARIARVRRDFLHKLSTRLCRENQAVGIEDLHVRGMLANSRLARSNADIGFYEFRRQLTYKAARYGTTIVVADRWFPSSRLCSCCGVKNNTLGLGERAWTCACGVLHDRDVNAAINLKRLAAAVLGVGMALPEASQTAMPGTAAGSNPAGGGKVTPVRHEYGHKDGSGQEEDAAHLCARFR